MGSAQQQQSEVPPGVPVTADQLAAFNLRYWRRAAGLTQEEAAALLRMSVGNLSNAERSWDGDKDRRRFDAQTLTEMALALGVPLLAFFLPPPDDGTAARYLVAAGASRYTMGDIMTLVVMPDGDDESPVMSAYRERFNAAAAAYLDPQWAAVAGRLLGAGAAPQARADMAARLSDARAGLLAAAELLGTLADGVAEPREIERPEDAA
jgi:hypothetical protein